jgi:regulator of protease activity HflC (stomatin/prohibitin superfamily)
VNAQNVLEVALGAGSVLGLAGIAVLAFRYLTARVEDEEAVLVTRWGRLSQVLDKPGLHVLPSRVLPWVRLVPVSLRHDFRHFEAIAVNDARGTTVVVDAWLELRVVDPAKATFEVADWDRSLKNLVTHSVISILGNRDFHEILRDRSELGSLLQKDIATETARWGIAIDHVFIRNVSLRPEVTRQLYDTIAARLERAMADIEEEGLQRAALLEAETNARIAGLVAEAKGQYPAAVGRALGALRDRPKVLTAYNELYELSVLRPHRTVAFQGFDEGAPLRAVDAAMLVPMSPLETAESPKG